MSRTDMKKHNRLKVTLNHDRKLSPNLTQSFLSTLASGQERFIWFVMTDDKKTTHSVIYFGGLVCLHTECSAAESVALSLT